MKGQVLSRSARRCGVIANYSGAVLFGAAFLVGEYTRWTPGLVVIVVFATAMVGISLYLTLIRTDLWRLTHESFENLDEREIQITHNSLRRSYGLFTAVSMAIVVFMAFSVRFEFFTLTHRGHYSFGLVVLILLQYLIQTLPATTLAWTEKQVAVR